MMVLSTASAARRLWFIARTTREAGKFSTKSIRDGSRAKDFILAKWFERYGFDRCNGYRIANSIERFDGISLDTIGRNVPFDRFDDIAALQTMFGDIACQYRLFV
jgi:hypothetical protein